MRVRVPPPAPASRGTATPSISPKVPGSPRCPRPYPDLDNAILVPLAGALDRRKPLIPMDAPTVYSFRASDISGSAQLRCSADNVARRRWITMSRTRDIVTLLTLALVPVSSTPAVAPVGTARAAGVSTAASILERICTSSITPKLLKVTVLDSADYRIPGAAVSVLAPVARAVVASAETGRDGTAVFEKPFWLHSERPLFVVAAVRGFVTAGVEAVQETNCADSFDVAIRLRVRPIP